MANDILKHYEGLHDGDLHQIGLQPKMDPVGIWTEGWGRAMLYKGKFLKGSANEAIANKLATIKTIEQADAALVSDLNPIWAIIARKITILLTQLQKETLASHIYNTGGSSTLYNLINSRSPELANWWMAHYITGQGNPKPQPGLVYRRKTEALYFTTGVLKFYN